MNIRTEELRRVTRQRSIFRSRHSLYALFGESRHLAKTRLEIICQ